MSHSTKILTLVYLVKEDNILMLRRSPDKSFMPNALVGPGGKLEPGETPERCAAREFIEETHLLPGTLFHRATWFYETNSPNNRQGCVYIFTLNSWEGKFHPHVEDGVLEWWNIDTLLASGELRPDHQHFMTALFGKNAVPIQNHYVCHSRWYDKKLISFTDSISWLNAQGSTP